MSFSINQSTSILVRRTKAERKFMLLCITLMLISAQAFAQQAPTGHAAVWQEIQEYWSLWAKRDLDGCMKYHHAGYSGWFHDSPAHRGKKVTRQWLETQFERLEVIFYEINAIDIKIHDHSAVVHYYISSIERDDKGEAYKQTFRRTDHLIREKEKWALIAHHDSLEQ